MIVGYPYLYSHREKSDISFEITNEKLHLFLSMLLLSGCHKLPDRKKCWFNALRLSIFFEISIFVIIKNLKNKKNSCKKLLKNSSCD